MYLTLRNAVMTVFFIPIDFLSRAWIGSATMPNRCVRSDHKIYIYVPIHRYCVRKKLKNIKMCDGFGFCMRTIYIIAFYTV